MRLTIFGATGQTGLPLTRQALERGHEVVAFVRTPAKMTFQHDHLTVVQGDASDVAAVSNAVAGADAVLSALGHVKGSPADIQTVATRNIITGMKEHGVRRLISLSGAGVPAPQDQPGFINHIIAFLLKLFSGDVLEDAKQHVRVLEQASNDVDWTVVRGPRLTNQPGDGNYRVGWVGVNTGTAASRENVADFMLKQIDDDTYVHQMPMISD